MKKINERRQFAIVGLLVFFVVIGLALDKRLSQQPKIQWVSTIGTGLVAPACGSSVPTATCVSGVAQAAISYDYSADPACGVAWVPYIKLSDGRAFSDCSPKDFRGCGCAGTMYFNNLPSNTSYTYSVYHTDNLSTPHDANVGSFNTPICAASSASAVAITTCTAGGAAQASIAYHISSCSSATVILGGTSQSLGCSGTAVFGSLSQHTNYSYSISYVDTSGTSHTGPSDTVATPVCS